MPPLKVLFLYPKESTNSMGTAYFRNVRMHSDTHTHTHAYMHKLWLSGVVAVVEFEFKIVHVNVCNVIIKMLVDFSLKCWFLT